MKHYPESIDILYFIEHTDRELAAAKKISDHLKNKHNLKVVITSQIFDSFTSLIKFKPKVLVTPTPSFSSGSAGWMFYSIYGNEINYVSLNYEQILGSWESASKMIFSEVSKSHQKHFAWGQNFFDILKKNGIEEKNIHLTGRPTNSIIHNDLKTNSKNIKKKFCDELQLQHDSKFYLFALTDGIAFCSPEIVRSTASRGFSEEKMTELANYIRDTIKVMISWMEGISPLLSSNEYLILRPHPSVSEEEYIELIREEIGFIPKNLKVTKMGNAQEWLAACDIYLTNYSTLLLDADFLSTPSFLLDPIESEFRENHWFCSGRKRLTSEDDFKAIFKDHVTFNITEKNLEEYFAPGLDAVDVSSNLISSFCMEGSEKGWKFQDLVKILISSPKRVVGSLIRKILMMTDNDFAKNFVKKGLTYDYFRNIKN